jgi:hypothetical protein
MLTVSPSTTVLSKPNSGLPRDAEAWAKTSRAEATIGPIWL